MTKQALHPRTASMNSKQKTQAKSARHQALCWLAATFPQAFDNQIQIRPLKVGIMHDILLHAEQAKNHAISKSKLREAVVLFTRRIDYLACLKAQEMRVDLHGNPTSAVTIEDAERAALKIKKRIEKNIKNTRKTASSAVSQLKKTSAVKATTPPHVPTQPALKTATPLPPHHYPEPMVLRTQTTPNTRTTTSVTIKPARTFDPNAIARLKEKLGIPRRNEMNDIEEETK